MARALLPKDRWVRCARCGRWLRTLEAIGKGIGPTCLLILQREQKLKAKAALTKLRNSQLSLFSHYNGQV